jgi:hypothetical protein
MMLLSSTRLLSNKEDNTMSEERFDCSSCGQDYDRESAVKECRICHRTYCDECISDEGICVPCREE